MPHRFTCTERVQFSDTDMAGIVHFSNFFRYMERVEHAFFRSLGFSIVDPPVEGAERVGWPRVHAACDYMAPLRFEEEFECELLVEEVRSKVIRHIIRFWKSDGVLAAEGRITAACVLQRFVTGNRPWAHLDIAGMAWSGKDLPTAPKGATAYGVRLLDRLVADHYEG
jgi:acyl-CoA thioester hydrolase